MPRITINQINKQLARECIEAELHRDGDRFWVSGFAVEFARSTLMIVHRLSDKTLDQWIDDIKEIASDSEDHTPLFRHSN